MITDTAYAAYIAILREELVPALGCTEPIAVAYAAARARDILGKRPEGIVMTCSGNIIKNVKGVMVPNTGGLKGIEAAAIAGIVGGDAGKVLEVLQSVRPEHLEAIRALMAGAYCEVRLQEGVENLYIQAEVAAGEEKATVRIEGSHTNIVFEERNGVVLKDLETEESKVPDDVDADFAGPVLSAHGAALNVRDILEFASTVAISDIEKVITDQISMNEAISDEGMAKPYGADVGKSLLKHRGQDVRTRAVARSAAGSDARMSGCAMPVVINSGSGNQGMTVSLPVIEFAGEMGATKESLYRALVLSNLIAIHQKLQIGKLSAYCGAVSAACGSGAGIAYLRGGDYELICDTITNTLANVSGIVCDGAKPSCAAKIASAVDAAIMAQDMAFDGKSFKAGDGLVTEDVEGTISNIGRMGKLGMKSTDVEILNMMIKKK